LSRRWQIFQLTASHTCMQVLQAGAEDLLGVAPDLDLADTTPRRTCGPGLADEVAVFAQAVLAQRLHDLVALAVRTCSSTPSSSLNSALSVSSWRRALTWPAQFLAVAELMRGCR
jgi:hypothetical protein